MFQTQNMRVMSQRTCASRSQPRKLITSARGATPTFVIATPMIKMVVNRVLTSTSAPSQKLPVYIMPSPGVTTSSAAARNRVLARTVDADVTSGRDVTNGGETVTGAGVATGATCDVGAIGVEAIWAATCAAI